MMLKIKIAFTFLLLTLSVNFFASKKLESLFTELKKTNDTEKKGRTLNLIADQYLDINLEESKKYAQFALQNGLNNNNIKITSDAYINLGNYHNIKGDLDSNLYYYEKSYQLCLTGKDKNEIAAALNRIGIVYEVKSDYNKATKYFLQAIKYYKQANNQKGIANVYNSLGIINGWISNKEKAINYYHQALALHKRTGDQIGYASTLNNIGEVYSEENNSDSAFIYFNQAAVILLKQGDFLSLATPYNNIGSIFYKNNQLDSAKLYHNKALKLYLQLEYKSGIANTYQNLSYVHTAKNEFDSAQIYLEEVLILRREVGNLQGEYQALFELSKTSSHLKNYQAALAYYKEYSILKDNVMGGEMLSKVNELQEKYSSLEKDQQIIVLEKDANRKRNQMYLLIASVILLLVVSLILTYSFRTKSKLLQQNKLVSFQQKELSQLSIEKKEVENNLLKKEIETQQKLNQLVEGKFKSELEHKNRELISLTVHLQNKNKVLGYIKQSLQNLMKSPFSEFEWNTKKIIKNIDFNIKLDSDWDQFKIHFDKVNVDFFKHLQAKYPHLSQNDLKLCAYLKINLSSKEMAQLLNISIPGINKSRNRLRKKLSLSSDINLTTFILGF